MELFITIHRDLVQSKVWEPPKLFFDSSVSRQTVQQLTEIVKRHQVRKREGGGGGEGGKKEDRERIGRVLIKLRESREYR